MKTKKEDKKDKTKTAEDKLKDLASTVDSAPEETTFLDEADDDTSLEKWEEEVNKA